MLILLQSKMMLVHHTNSVEKAKLLQPWVREETVDDVANPHFFCLSQRKSSVFSTLSLRRREGVYAAGENMNQRHLVIEEGYK
jgi:hypothetical protein